MSNMSRDIKIKDELKGNIKNKKNQQKLGIL